MCFIKISLVAILAGNWVDTTGDWETSQKFTPGFKIGNNVRARIKEHCWSGKEEKDLEKRINTHIQRPEKKKGSGPGSFISSKYSPNPLTNVLVKYQFFSSRLTFGSHSEWERSREGTVFPFNIQGELFLRPLQPPLQNLIYLFLRLPWWLRQWRIHLQRKRRGFDPWAEKISWRREWQPVYSCLENSMDSGAWRGTVHGVAKSWTRLSD